MKDVYFHHSKGTGARGSISNPPIAVLSNRPVSENAVKLTPEWYKNPTLPIVPLRELFPTSILNDPEALMCYVEQFARERGGDVDRMYISVYPNLFKQVAEQ